MNMTDEDLCKWWQSREGPDWRWRLAGGRGPIPPGKLLHPKNDICLQQARDYLRRREHGPEQPTEVEKEYAHVAAALRLNRHFPSCDALKILVLADCGVEEIAERLQTDVHTIQTWEALFFDVRTVRQAIGWVNAWVMEPLLQCGNGILAAKLKLAYVTGPITARGILDAPSRMPWDQGRRVFYQSLQLCLKADAAIQTPIDSERQRSRFVIQHLKYLNREGRLRLAERKLEHTCQNALAKHQLAEARLAFARQREQCRTDKARERDQRLQRFQAVAAARQREREERLRQIKERATRSPLAQLRWASSPAPVLAASANGEDNQGRSDVARGRSSEQVKKRQLSSAGNDVAKLYTAPLRVDTESRTPARTKWSRGTVKMFSPLSE